MVAAPARPKGGVMKIFNVFENLAYYLTTQIKLSILYNHFGLKLNSMLRPSRFYRTHGTFVPNILLYF